MINTKINVLVLLGVLLCLPFMAHAKSKKIKPTVVPTISADEPAKQIIPAKTVFTVISDKLIKAKDATEGEKLTFTVNGGIVDEEGHILVKDGASGVGTITFVGRRKTGGIDARLEFSIDNVAAVDGTEVPLNTIVKLGHMSTAKKVLKFGISKGKKTTLKAGKRIEVTVAKDTIVTRSESDKEK